MNGPTSDLVRDARAVFAAATASVRPTALLDRVDLGPLDGYRRVVLVGAGKAAMAMAGALEARLGGRIDEGLVVVPYGYRETFPSDAPAPRRVEVVEALHPVPDEAGVRAARRTLTLAEALRPDDLLLVALSGGGSALWPAFGSSSPLGPNAAPPLPLADVQWTFRLLLQSGADIHAINTVRRHLSQIGGGKLARVAYPASVLTLVISDVVGDDLAAIASGPTVPDPTTFADAVAVLERYDLLERVSAPIRDHLLWGMDQPMALPERPVLDRARTLLIGSNADALAAAQAEAERRGYAVCAHRAPSTGEARAVGREQARAALDLHPARPTCLLWGGETTVTVTGDGRGGRNQELALAAALELDGANREGTERDIVLLSAGTDGIDGPTDAAGAWARSRTVAEAHALGLDAADHLARNNAYPIFDAVGGLVRTGPTHTNVMDLQVALILP